MKGLRNILVLVLAAACGGCAQQSTKTGINTIVKKLFGPSPVELVSQMFESEDPDLRRTAIVELSRHDWGRRGAYLKAYAILTDDPAATVRSAAVRALGRGGDAKYAREIILVLADREASVRADAAVALDSIFAPETIEPLSARATSDVSPDVRVAAARALRQYRQANVLETLLRCLDDPKLAVRSRAAESLTELTGENAGTEARAWRRALAGRKDPFDHPAVKPDRKRWWNWFSRRGGKRDKRDDVAPASQPE